MAAAVPAVVDMILQADQALVGLIARIRDDQCDLVLPPVFDRRLHSGGLARRSAHDLAALLEQPDPLTDELARGMYEGTAPSADMWRSFGIYRAERPVPDGASWRERFLALTGRGTLPG